MALPLPTRTNGQTIDQTWFNLINTELVALDAKHESLADENAITFDLRMPLDLETNNRVGLGFLTLQQDITLESVRSAIETNGASGNFEIDIKFRRNFGSWTSVLQTRPVIPSTAGNNTTSDTGTGATAGIIDSTYDSLLAGDQLRLDIIDVPTGTPANGFVELKVRTTGA